MRIGAALLGWRSASSWWPQGAVYAADFVNQRYMRDGLPISAAEAFTFARASLAWAEDLQGRLHEFAADQPRLTNRGLLLEVERTRLSFAPAAIGSTYWSAEGSATHTVLSGEAPFATPCRIASGGQVFSRRTSNAIALNSGQTVHIKARYRAGTSPNFGVYMRNNAGAQSILQGAVGSLSTNSSGAGSWSNITNTALPDGTVEIATNFTPATTDSYRLGLSPRSDISGEYVDVLGALLASGSGQLAWILGEVAGSQLAVEDALHLQLPVGALSIAITNSAGSDTHEVLSDGTWPVSAGQTVTAIYAG